MRDAASVITEATKKIVEDLAAFYEVRNGRMYEILSTDCPYPRTKRLIRAIAHCDKSPDKRRVKLIKADLDALFSELLSEEVQGEVNDADMHSELSDAIHAKLKGCCRAERLKECREAVSVLNDEIAYLEKQEVKTYF